MYKEDKIGDNPDPTIIRKLHYCGHKKARAISLRASKHLYW